jgi:hypothetical protein
MNFLQQDYGQAYLIIIKFKDKTDLSKVSCSL